ncbi:MAG: hypothetical protein VX086_04765 [Pseudomonadota bacterium]|nr:hypothetical protein [Pseudomonadota bacterium]
MNQPCLKGENQGGIYRRTYSCGFLGGNFDAFFAKEKFYEKIMSRLIFNFLRLFLLWLFGRTRFSMIQIGASLISRYIKRSVGGWYTNPEMKKRDLNEISSTLRLILGD